MSDGGAVIVEWSIYRGLRLQDTSEHLERFNYALIYSLVNISIELVGGCHIDYEDEVNQVMCPQEIASHKTQKSY